MRENVVASLVRVAVAPGTTAPVVSVISARKAPELWASTGAAIKATIATASDALHRNADVCGTGSKA